MYHAGAVRVSSTTKGELRASKGALIFIPEGTDRYLRVEVDLDLPPSFRSGKAALTLVAAAKATAEHPRAPAALEPEHGVPTRASGEVLERRDGALLVDTGVVRLLVTTAEGRSGRVICELEGPLRGADVRLEP